MPGRRSFAARLMLLLGLTSGLLAAVICAVLVSFNYGRTRAMAIENVEALARTLGIHSAAALEFNDRDAGRETLAALRAVPEVASATIRDAAGDVFAEYGRRGGGAVPSIAAMPSGSEIVDGWLVHAGPIRANAREVGTLRLVYDMASITERMRRNMLLSLAAGMLALGVGLAIAARLQYVVTRPVAELVATARKVSERRDFSLQARKFSDDELGAFTDEFNRMLARLDEQDAQLSAAHERFRATVEAAPNGMIMVDEKGSILLVNRQAEQMFGYDREALIGKPIEMLVPERHRAGHPEFRDGFVHTPSVRPMGAKRELHGRRSDGTEFPVEVGLNPIGTREGIRVLSSIVDITERRQAEQERARLLERERDAREEAERANRMKDEFLATLSHELRTPMTAILGWARILRAGGRSDEDVARGMEVIERNARTQGQIIEDLLDMSRIISGKVRLDVQLVDLPEVIESALATVRPAAEARAIRLQSILDRGVDPIRGDPNRLQQVMWNLLSNAIKFTPRGGRVQVALERINSHVEVSVSDTGQGIAPEFLPYVFERFRQSDATTSREHGGLGLGLAIVKQLVELHGGSVHVKSPGEGRGATFIVHLPVAVVHAPRDAGDVHPRMSRPDPDPRDAAEPSLRGVRVLVVDDEPDARELVALLLADHGAEVHRAESAGEAIERIRKDGFDVLVSDIGMPRVDGYELIRRVRELPASDGGGLPAIALTAFARSEDRTRALLTGYQLHVAKPVEPSELVASVSSLVRESRQVDPGQQSC